MKNFLLSFSFGILSVGANAQTKVPSPEIQLKTAVLAAPSDKRTDATVYGYNQQKELVLLRKGKNEIICLGDDPDQKGFSVSAYHRDLEPFMARGRELKKAGKSTQEIFDTREKEAKARSLKMPKQASTLFVFSAQDEGVDATTGEVKNGYLRYVVYIPYGTAESTGLPLKPEGPAMPWIMHPGTHGAHIMINPPQSK